MCACAPPGSPDRIAQRYLRTGPDAPPPTLSKVIGRCGGEKAASPARLSRVAGVHAPVPGARLCPGLVDGATRPHISRPVASALRLPPVRPV